jgi:hypothetical protein
LQDLSGLLHSSLYREEEEEEEEKKSRLHFRNSACKIVVEKELRKCGRL